MKLGHVNLKNQILPLHYVGVAFSRDIYESLIIQVRKIRSANFIGFDSFELVNHTEPDFKVRLRFVLLTLFYLCRSLKIEEKSRENTGGQKK